MNLILTTTKAAPLMTSELPAGKIRWAQKGIGNMQVATDSEPNAPKTACKLYWIKPGDNIPQIGTANGQPVYPGYCCLVHDLNSGKVLGELRSNCVA